jgi:hypothetical protein
MVNHKENNNQIFIELSTIQGKICGRSLFWGVKEIKVSPRHFPTGV